MFPSWTAPVRFPEGDRRVGAGSTILFSFNLASAPICACAVAVPVVARPIKSARAAHLPLVISPSFSPQCARSETLSDVLPACNKIVSYGSPISIQHMARDDHLHHFARAFRDAVAALLAPELLDRKVGRQCNAPMNLHAFVGRLECHFVGEIFAHIAV